MFVTNRTPEYDYIIHERIDVLVNHGYCGFTVDRITGDPIAGDFIVEASNRNGVTLSAKGDTKEDACKRMIDLIDVTIDDY